MIGSLIGQGAKIIEPEDARLGPYQYYDQYYETQEGGRAYIEPGQEYLVLRNGSVLSNSDEVGAATLEFHRYLRDDAPQLIHPLMREVYLTTMAMERERLSRVEQAAGVTPGLAYKVERQIKRIELMEQDWAAYESTLGADPVAVSPVKTDRKMRIKTAATEDASA